MAWDVRMSMSAHERKSVCVTTQRQKGLKKVKNSELSNIHPVSTQPQLSYVFTHQPES